MAKPSDQSVKSVLKFFRAIYTNFHRLAHFLSGIALAPDQQGLNFKFLDQRKDFVD